MICLRNVRDVHLSWDVVVGSLVVFMVLCGAYSVSYPQPPWRGVLWVLTGTHPCDTSTQAGWWWRYQSASSYVRAGVVGVIVDVVVSVAGGFVVKCC